MICTIDRLQAENFRGIRRINLPVDGCSLIVVGENGAGKSSIVDAIEYFFTGRVHPLEGRGDVDKGQSIPHLHGGSTQVRLSLRGLPPEVGASLPYPQRAAAIPPSLKPVTDLAGRRSFILRRSQILTFINARDAQRYEEISQLIGLSRLDQMDKCWRKECNAAQNRLSQLREDYHGILDRMGVLLGAEVRMEGDIIRAVNAQLGDLGLGPITGRNDLQQRQEALKRSFQIKDDVTKAERLRSLLEQVEKTAPRLHELSSQYRDLGETARVFWDRSKILEDSYLEPLLDEGHRILRERQWISTCPLCEEPLRDRDALLRRLDERLHKMQGLAESKKRLSALEEAIEGSLFFLDTSLENLEQGLEVNGLTKYLPVIQTARAEVRRQRSSLRRPDRERWRAGSYEQDPSMADLLEALTKIEEKAQRKIEALAPTEAEKTALEWLMAVAQVDEQWQMLQSKAVEIDKTKYVSDQISLVYNELIEARKRGLERLRLDLEEDFDRLYQQLHPDEGYKAISIPVQHGQRSSVALRTRFHDQEASHPLGYYSEGHLDSLGLCIFLAFIKRFNQDLKLIVLDDVLTTVDAGHRLRVARLLAREFSDYQLVITTHDKLWANELKGIIPNSKLVQLRRWTLGQGVDYQDNVPSDWDYYAQQAEEGRPKDTIGGAGRNLEKFLYQMRGKLGLAIPARPDGIYTIGDLYDPFWSWVTKYQPARPDRPDFAMELEGLHRELDEVWRLRNWSGAHFNTWAETVTPEEALAFLYAIERLVTSFECPVCQNLVAYSSASKALLCSWCQPCPPPQAICEYKPDWGARIAKIQTAPQAKVRRQAVGMAQSVCRAFLRDMRRRLSFEVLATPDDQYDLPDLYTPFFEWVKLHPLDGRSDWEQIIAERKQLLDAYWQEDQWLDVEDAGIQGFVDTVRQLTTLFECSDCSQLLSYDHDQGTYFCPKCREQETIPSRVPAYWFVRKG